MLSVEQVMEYLPQRYPFLFVDRVTELEPGKRAVGYKNVSFNEDFFNGHFPGKPIMPGVLIIEAMAQMCGVLGISGSSHRPSDGYLYLFCGADNVRFKRPVVPGDRLVMEAELLTSKRNIFKFKCTATVDGELAAAAELLIAEQKV